MTDADRARRLPPGQHGIPPALVARNQRERLIAAMAEVCAEEGYAASTVSAVARRAGVSTGSFYSQFEGRVECMLASFGELSGRLLVEVERACSGEGEPAERVRPPIQRAVDLLAADLPTARLLSVEILAVGSEGLRLQHEAIERLARRLAKMRNRRGEGSSPAFPIREWTAVTAMVALVAKRVVEGEAPVATELEAVCDWL
jgi:AcrR family transcriptional regulator